MSSLTPTCLDDIHDLVIKISSRPTSVLFTACTLPVGTRLPLLNASAPTGTPTSGDPASDTRTLLTAQLESVNGPHRDSGNGNKPTNTPLAGLISRQAPSASKQDGTHTGLWRWQSCDSSRHSRCPNLAAVTADVAFCQAAERTSGTTPADLTRGPLYGAAGTLWTTHRSGPSFLPHRWHVLDPTHPLQHCWHALDDRVFLKGSISLTMRFEHCLVKFTVNRGKQR